MKKYLKVLLALVALSGSGAGIFISVNLAIHVYIQMPALSWADTVKGDPNA